MEGVGRNTAPNNWRRSIPTWTQCVVSKPSLGCPDTRGFWVRCRRHITTFTCIGWWSEEMFTSKDATKKGEDQTEWCQMWKPRVHSSYLQWRKVTDIIILHFLLLVYTTLFIPSCLLKSIRECVACSSGIECYSCSIAVVAYRNSDKVHSLGILLATIYNSQESGDKPIYGQTYWRLRTASWRAQIRLHPLIYEWAPAVSIFNVRPQILDTPVEPSEPFRKRSCILRTLRTTRTGYRRQ